MIKNNLSIAIRNILKNKLFAAINIIGLAIGLAIFIFAQLFAGYERSHDAFFPGVDRMFAVYTHIRPEANLGTTVLDYHDRLLSYGSPPVRFVRALLHDQPIPE